MDPSLIHRLVREAGFTFSNVLLERLIVLVAEEAAKLCDEQTKALENSSCPEEAWGSVACAQAIRDRFCAANSKG